MGKYAVGGQAVIEGVLMKNEHRVAIAVRRPDNKISLRKIKFRSIGDRLGFMKWPFFRGMVNLVEQLVLGMKALNYSANEALGEEEEKIGGWEFLVTTVVAMGMAIGLFVFLPLYLAKFTQTAGVLFNIIDGVIRITLFIAYVGVISLMSDVKKLFQYHGAEHMTVNCYEDGKKITVANVKKYGTAHRRCGTTFLLIVLLVAIIVFSFVITDSFWIKFGARILLLPVIAGVSYELLKLGARFDNWFVRALVWPGLMLQSMTTRKPNAKQIEVAIKSFKAVVRKC